MIAMTQLALASAENTEPNSANWDAGGQLEVLTFTIGEECLAVEAVMIREILDLMPETRVPGASSLVPSVINFRGKIIPLADLRVAFRMPIAEPTVDSRIVVIELETAGEPTQVGLRTDKVHEVTTLSRRDSSQPPVLGLRWPRHYVREFVRQSDGVIVLPDIDAIFASSKAGSGSIRARGGLN